MTDCEKALNISGKTKGKNSYDEWADEKFSSCYGLSDDEKNSLIQ